MARTNGPALLFAGSKGMATTIGNRVPDSGLSPREERHEVDLLLHEDSDHTSTRVESEREKKKSAVTDAINISELGTFGGPDGIQSEIGIRNVKFPKGMSKGETRLK